jgi:hypothetical protein
MGKVQGKEEVKTKSLIFVDEVLETSNMSGMATKLKRTYEKAELGKDGKTTKLTLEGKTILIEKKGDKFAFTLDGESLSGDSLKLLDSEFNRPDKKDNQDFFFPKTPVKEGDTWKVDPSEMIKSVSDSGLILDKEKATAVSTLTKSYKKDQSQFGKMSFLFEAPVTSVGQKNQITIKEGVMKIKMVGDGCLDGSTPNGTLILTVKARIVGSVMGIDLNIDSDATETKSVELIEK